MCDVTSQSLHTKLVVIKRKWQQLRQCQGNPRCQERIQETKNAAVSAWLDQDARSGLLDLGHLHQPRTNSVEDVKHQV